MKSLHHIAICLMLGLLSGTILPVAAQEDWNDLYYFKMTYHNWDTIVYDSFELSVNDDGIAVWESIYTDGYDHSEEYAVDEEDYGYYDEYGGFIYYE